MKYLIVILALLLTPQQAPTLTAVWQKDNALHVAWSAPGFHTVWLDNQPVDSGVNSKAFKMPERGVSAAYSPMPGQTLRLVDYAGNTNALVIVPARVYRVILPIIAH